MLLRTLDADHTAASRVGDQLVPCCGHAWFASGPADVMVIGCVYGLDWEVRHAAGHVALRFDGRPDVGLSWTAWRDAVVAFCDAVQQFHDTSAPKAPVPREDAAGVAAFHAEWRHRYARAGAPGVGRGHQGKEDGA